nr:hypothetical protein [Tanacetum cinerariifolium]
KIVAKVLANRLSKVIDNVVSKEQSAFISGRQILDGLLSLVRLSSGLHGVMSNTVNSGLIRDIKLGSSDITLSHLFYADDVVITSEWNSGDLDNVIWVLHVFHLASGLKINIHKSNIYDIGVSNEEVSSMASRTGCAAGSFPFTYLGLSIGSNMNLTSSWNILVDHFQKRLSSWKANLLSIGWRLTLIKAVLGSLGIYYLSIFKAPEVILKSLERLRGMNIGSLKAFNLALLQKWRWRLFSSPNAHWVKVIKALHGQEGGLDHQERSQVDLNSEDDTCIWSMADDGVFSVRSIRRVIDSKLLPSMLSATTWEKLSRHAPKEKSRRIHVIFTASFWWMWRYRNRITFCAQSMWKSDLFDSIRSSSYYWLSHRGRMTTNWLEWPKILCCRRVRDEYKLEN